MTNADAIAALGTLARTRGETLHTNYSGRGMRDKTCYGISTDRPTELIEDAAADGIKGAHTDQLGKHTIVYWPKVTNDV